MPQQTPLTPEQVQDLIQDWKTGVLTGEKLATRPDILQQVAPFLQGPPADRPGAMQSLGMFAGDVASSPGTFESGLPLPASLLSFLPGGKPLGVITAGVLGGLGAGVDTVREGRYSISDVLAGATRQGALQLGGNALAGPAPRGMARSVMPHLSDAGADTALSMRGRLDIRPVGRNAEAAAEKVSERGDRVRQSIEAIDQKYGNRPFIDRSELHVGADDVRARRVGRSMEEDATAQKFDTQIAREQQGPTRLRAVDVLEKKRGADEGYDALDRSLKTGKGIEAKKATKRLVGNNARHILEREDEARLKSLMERIRFGSLHEQNEKLGGAMNLKKIIDTEGSGSRGGLLARAATGTLVGGAASGAYGLTQGQDIGSGSILNRYGLPGVATGAAFGAAPFASAKALRLLGQTVPDAERIYEILAELEQQEQP